MKLNEVTINKTDTCLTYAFKRIGHESPINDIGDIEQQYKLLNYSIKTKLKIGDILIFTHKEKVKALGMQIMTDGLIIDHNVICLRHCVVYEGKDRISDLTRTAVENSSVPSLRMRLLKEIVALPTHILRLSKKQKTTS